MRISINLRLAGLSFRSSPEFHHQSLLARDLVPILAYTKQKSLDPKLVNPTPGLRMHLPCGENPFIDRMPAG